MTKNLIYFLLFIIIFAIKVNAQEEGNYVKLINTNIEVWLPDNWTYEQNESLNVNDPKSLILMMFFPLHNSKMEGTAIDYGKNIMKMMFKNYQETSKPTDIEMDDLLFTEIDGKGILHQEEVNIARMYITDINETHHLFIILSGKDKDIKKLQPEIDRILEEL